MPFPGSRANDGMRVRRILLVDPAGDDRSLAARLLRASAGAFSVDEAADAVTFADKLARGEFDAAVCELHLGWADGLAVLEAVKRLRPQRPVVLFTADPPAEALARAFHLGLDRWVPKGSAGFLALPEAVAEALERPREPRPADVADRPLLERLPVGIFSASREGGLARANPELARILGRSSPAELWGEDLAGYLAEPEARDRWRRLLAAGDAPGAEIRDLEVRLQRADGEPAWARMTAWPLAAGGGCEGTLEEITAYKHAQEELSERAEALNRSNAELEDFAHVVSHDLQAPLGLVARYARLLAERSGAGLDDEGSDYLQHLVDNAGRMQRMIDDILEYSRAGSVDRTFQTVDLGSVVDDAVANLAALAEETGAGVTRDELPLVSAVRAQMVQLFQNLIGNAIKFHGDEPPRVHVSAGEAGGAWRVSVKDNGTGIAPEHHQRIFKMFQRAHCESQYPGSGVGLAICKRIIERHGGAIAVESVPGRGATFTVRLPKPVLEETGAPARSR